MNSSRRRWLSTGLAVLMGILALAPAAPAADPRSGGASDPLFYFSGTGRAHGVGMCMDGVYYRAKEGQGYRQILSHYYTGISFSRTDENRPIRVKGRDGVVRTLTMKEYLRHLQEEPDNYPFEELKALYVAARTYTLSCIARGKHAREGFDVCSSGDCCQAFDENKDVTKYPNCNAAQDATAGEIMTYDGQPIIAAYCGSCGGHSENNEDVWNGTPIPYLRGKPDPYCQNSPRYAWSATFRKSELEARFNSRSDTAVGSLSAIDLSERTPGGRVKYARISGSGGTKRVSGGTLQGILGFQSTKFDMVRPNFDEYILVLNPNPEPTIVTFTFMRPDGTTTDHFEEVAGNARFTLKLNDYVQFQEVSTRVVSDLPVIAERATYFDYHGSFSGGSGSTGVKEPCDRWYFAEGYTGGSFETYILVQNPQPVDVSLRFTFMKPGGGVVKKTASAQAYSRTTVMVDDVPGLEDTEVSTLVECTSGDEVVAERSCYFEHQGRVGGHNSPGAAQPSLRWYLAEGFTGGGFDSYILLQNPLSRTALVDAIFMKENGESVTRTCRVPAFSRYTIHADEEPGLEDAGFSCELVSRNGVSFIAERAVYFDRGAGQSGGHGSMGVTAPSAKWFFAEGYTGGAFNTFVLLQNPSAKTARVRLTFSRPSGASVRCEYGIKGRSRFTVHVDELEGLADAEVATTVQSTNGVKVVAERAVYFNYTDGYCLRGGGHDTAGVTGPSTCWYFAEGYTGF
jgi:SpoIID/LytB domain protein